MVTFVMNQEHFHAEIDECIKQISSEVHVDHSTLDALVRIFLSLKYDVLKKPFLPRGIIFHGPPGTGKTLLMKTLTKVITSADPLIIRGPEIYSEYYGKTERNLRRVFAMGREIAKEHGLSVIYIDELDSIAPRRDLVHGDLEPRVVGQLLTLMDGLEKEKDDEEGQVIVIGSTNRMEALDPALLRPGRFDFKFEFTLPDETGRKKILEIHLREYFRNSAKGTSAVDKLDKYKEELEELARLTPNFSGADIRHLVNLTILTLDSLPHVDETELFKKMKELAKILIPSHSQDLLYSLDTVYRDNLSTSSPSSTTSLGNVSSLPDDIFTTLPIIIHDQSVNSSSKKNYLKTLSQKWLQSDSSLTRILVLTVKRPHLLAKLDFHDGRGDDLVNRLVNHVMKLQPCIVHVPALDVVLNYSQQASLHLLYHIHSMLEELQERQAKVIVCLSKLEPRNNGVKEFMERLTRVMEGNQPDRKIVISI